MTNRAGSGALTGVDDIYPLTPTQLGILFDSLRDTDPELYFEQVRCDLVGDVDVDALHRAWTATIAHHPALRTIWLWDGLDDPVQVVRTSVELPWVELEQRSEPDQRHAVDELARLDRSTGFDLTKPPVARVTVIRLADDRVHMIWSFHHIMLDGWSAALVLDEVLGRCGGRTPPPAPPFREHLAWIARQDNDQARAHWRSLLDGFDEPTRLAMDLRPTDATFRLARTTAELDESTTNRLTAVAREHRTTTNTLVQAAWATVVSSNSGDDDVVFGVTGSGRAAEVDDVERVVGMFLATLPMRVRFDGDVPISDWWAEIQRQQLDLTHFQYSSLADVVRWSDVPAGVPLFDTAVIFENYPRRDGDAGPVAIEHRQVFEQTRFPLTLMIGAEARLQVVALFDESRFERGTVDDLLTQFLRVLDRMTTDPDLPVRGLTVLTDEEREQVLVDWNRTDRPVPASTVHAEIERHAAADPNATAVIEGDRHWSYREIVDAAAALAARMQTAGAAPGQTIGVALPRSAEAIIALLAVIRSGAAYVPLEPDSPADRLAVIAHDAHITMALTAPAFEPLVAGLGLPVIDVTGSNVELEPLPAATVGADDPMFVVFTSGSTGRPKGVPGSHRAVLNRIAWQLETYPFTDDEVACHKTTLGFVDHVAELWAPLVAGRSVVIVPDEVVRDVDEFVSTLARHRIRRIVMVPSLLEAVLDSVPDLATRLEQLRLWALSGERLPRSLADRFRAAMPHARLLNIYGMSEAMADVTCFDGEWTDSQEAVPIGRPIHNQRVYVLDRVGRPAPVGVPGQIWISGVGVSRGYWRREDLNAEKFLANEFGEGPHARRYASGDIGRWNHDGQLEYVGRIDRQVKVRGIRVELGEVEAAVRGLAGVSDVVVVDGSADHEATRLVAHVVTDGDVDLDEARKRLAARQPSHLVPAVFRRLDSIPLLPSGKTDLNALPGAAASAPPVRDDVDDELRTMMALWQDVIETGAVGPDDDFFDVGGHSIAAMRLMSRLKREHGVNLGLAVLYRHSTPRRLLTHVRSQADQDSPADSVEPDVRHLVPITRGTDPAQVVYCIHGAGGNVLNFHDLAQSLAPDWGVVGIQAAGVDGVTPPHRSLDEMCDAYIAEILADREDGPLFVAGFSGGGIIAYEIAVRLAARGRPVDAVVLLDTFHRSIQGRRRTVGEHASALVRQGPAYLAERVQVRRQRRMYERADEIVEAETPVDGPVPHELRDAHLVSNIRSLLDDYDTPDYDGPVWLFAATDVLDVFRHAGLDRGWSSSVSRLRAELVPGDHANFILEPNARHLGARLLERLNHVVANNPSGSARA